MGKRRTLRMEVDTKMIAKAMAINCIRNTILERYHQQGKLSDDDMKAFNKVVVNRIYTFLDCIQNRSNREKDLFLEKMVGISAGYTVNWDDPEFDGDTWQGVEAYLEELRIHDEAMAALANRPAPGQPISSTPPRPPASTPLPVPKP